MYNKIISRLQIIIIQCAIFNQRKGWLGVKRSPVCFAQIALPLNHKRAVCINEKKIVIIIINYCVYATTRQYHDVFYRHESGNARYSHLLCKRRTDEIFSLQGLRLTKISNILKTIGLYFIAIIL